MWFVSRFLIRNIEWFSRKNRLSPFVASFFILGMFTSIPELTIGLNALWDGQPAVFAGNLIGASFVLLMFVVPLFAFIAGGINLEHELKTKVFLLTLIVIAAPIFFVTDGAVNRAEALITILLYGWLVLIIDKGKNLFQSFEVIFSDAGANKRINMGKVIIGCGLIFIAGRILVEQTLYFSRFFQISPFMISLVVLSIGTNTPEFAIGIASVMRGKKTVALGDHLGSAAFNSFVFGVLAFIYGPFTLPAAHFRLTFLLFLAGGAIFFIFMRSRRRISRGESLIILGLYLLFLWLQTFG